MSLRVFEKYLHLIVNPVDEIYSPNRMLLRGAQWLSRAVLFRSYRNQAPLAMTYRLMCSLLAILFIRGRVHQIPCACIFELDHPCLPIGITVDGFRLVGQVFVDC